MSFAASTTNSLSTIRNANRIVVINHGKVREIGSHDELMMLGGHYKRLVLLQDLDNDTDRQGYKDAMKASAAAASAVVTSLIMDSEKLTSDSPTDGTKAVEKENARKARNLAKGDEFYLFIGAVGAVLAGCRYSITRSLHSSTVARCCPLKLFSVLLSVCFISFG